MTRTEEIIVKLTSIKKDIEDYSDFCLEQIEKYKKAYDKLYRTPKNVLLRNTAIKCNREATAGMIYRMTVAIEKKIDELDKVMLSVNSDNTIQRQIRRDAMISYNKTKKALDNVTRKWKGGDLNAICEVLREYECTVSG